MSNDDSNPAIADTSLPNQYSDGPLFPLGQQVVATPGALECCAKNR